MTLIHIPFNLASSKRDTDEAFAKVVGDHVYTLSMDPSLT